MASNIRETMSARPGIRVLVIAGASHEDYLEACVDQMHNLRVIGTNNILR